MVVHTYNPSIQEAEAGLRVLIHLGLQSKTWRKKKTRKEERKAEARL
jgi:hypothetical protein